MLTAVKNYIDRHCLLAPGSRVVAACSGGPDSLALVHLLAALRTDYAFSLAVAHVDHAQRGEESDADAAFVSGFADRLGLPCFTTKLAAADLTAAGRNFQDAARTLRYAYLRQVASELGGAVIATGHHRGDQAETVLFNLCRGAGGAGLGGMKPAEDGLIRPLLAVGRPAIDAYCRKNGLAPRLDRSNLKTDYRRNFLRLEVLPLLAEKLNPQVVDTLCRTAELIGDEHEYVAAQARSAWPGLVRTAGADLTVDCQGLSSLPSALRRELVRQLIEKKRGNLRGISFFHVEKLLETALFGTVGSIVELPGGLLVRRDYDSLTLTLASPVAPSAVIAPPGLALTVPGRTPVPALGITVTAALTDSRPTAAGPDVVLFDWEALAPPLFVRTRQAGDYFRPAGIGGGKKLKEFFIDAKVPRRLRDAVPVFADSQGIIWLGGLRQAQRGRPGPATRTYLQLTIDKRRIDDD